MSLQWFVDDLAVDGQVSDSFTFTASDTGTFVVNVLVTDGKDYVTHKWLVSVEQGTGGFSITGAAVGVVSKGGGSLFGWLRSLF